MTIKEVKYNLIRFGKINPDSSKTIEESLKAGSKKTWEYNIELLEEMTFYFTDIKNIILAFLNHPNGFIRETALLIIENGNFSTEEIEESFKNLINNKNKNVKSRVADLIIRNRKFHKYLYLTKSHFSESEIESLINSMK